MYLRKRFYLLLTCSVLIVVVIGIATTRVAALNVSDNTLAPAQLFPPEVLERTQRTARQATAYSRFSEVRDPTEALRIRVPVEWRDIDMGEWHYLGSPTGAYITASENLGRFNALQQPGVFFGASPTLAHTHTPTDILALEAGTLKPGCVLAGQYTYSDAYYRGLYNQYTGCAVGDPTLYIAALQTANRDTMLIVRVVVFDDADLDAMAKIFQSVQLVGRPVDDH